MTQSLINIEQIECYKCHIIIWLSEQHINRLRKSKEVFHCPNGHSQSFIGKTKAEEYREKFEEAKKSCDSTKKQLLNIQDKYYDLKVDLHEKKEEVVSLKKDVEKYKNILCPYCKKSYLLSKEERATLICKKCKKKNAAKT